ncbi:hypothetical protein V5O48_005217 [Marasmius crinis-equi]|uniref:Glutathione S-transferase n=1 Tax=Marasmius crinis-equi TaxID=585013 RepID=A0ABR3FMZ6_9AGAR
MSNRLSNDAIPYEVKLLLFDEIEPAAKAAGAPPTSIRADGTPRYTVPFIHDSYTGKSIAESFPIVEYLDRTYPETPQVLPPGTRVLQSVFIDAFQSVLAWKFGIWYSKELLESRKKVYGIDAKPPQPPTSEQRIENLKTAKAFFDGLDDAYRDHELVMGNTPVFADIALASHLVTMRMLLGDGSKEWEEVCGWNKGRIGKLIERILSYKRPGSSGR